MIIGISGKRGSGKDTVGPYIAEFAKKDGYRVFRRAFGDALKEEAAKFLDGHTYSGIKTMLDQYATAEWRIKILGELFANNLDPEWFLGHYLQIVDAMNDRRQKEQYRAYLQWWGTEYRREQYGDDYWLNHLQSWLEETQRFSSGKTLIWVPDDRFPNEQKFLEKIGAFTTRVNRPSEEIPDEHPSETALDDYRAFHMVITNDGSLDDLRNLSYRVYCAALAYTNGQAPL